MIQFPEKQAMPAYVVKGPIMWDPNYVISSVPADDSEAVYSSQKVVPTHNIDYFQDRDFEFKQKRRDIDESLLIPFIPDKAITLTNAGRVGSSARISTNVLDSLAKYGAMLDVAPVDALGLAARETSLGLYPGHLLYAPNPYIPAEVTFHGQNKLRDEGMVSPAELINNDRYFISPYNDAIAWAGRTVGGVRKVSDSGVEYDRHPATDLEMEAALAGGKAYADSQMRKLYLNEHPLAHGFRLFRNRQFNTGEPGYEQHVRSDGTALFNSPEIQNWWKNEGWKWYRGTKYENNPLGKTLFPQKHIYYDKESGKGYVFGTGGIHIKPENRGKFTALKERTGHSATWFKENGTPAQKKMAVFALNARKWKHGDGGLINRYGKDAVKQALENMKKKAQ